MLSKFVNCMMWDGKKSVSQNIFKMVSWKMCGIASHCSMNEMGQQQYIAVLGAWCLTVL